MLKPLYAILIDGGFMTKKLQGRLDRHVTADDICVESARIQALAAVADYELLRIYYYDAAPLSDTIQKPVSKERVNLSVTPRSLAAQSLLANLVLKPNFALRMGQLNLSPEKWRMKPSAARKLRREARPLQDDDFVLDIQQKGVDLRIGLDMARLALRDMVRAVVVVTGDSDFVPAFKYVRREGVKVILDPMGHNVRPELRHHADIVLES
ncbi:MAG: NYN domain-containing protein [Alphaproteobacteria bacterium]|nr:MAG: NYN domain-containing protein [Alphaproteobacteria bacterium]